MSVRTYNTYPFVAQVTAKNMILSTPILRVLIVGSMFGLTAIVLAGCGEVVVFGHVVREAKPSAKAEAELSTESQSGSSQSSSAQSNSTQSTSPQPAGSETTTSVAATNSTTIEDATKQSTTRSEFQTLQAVSVVLAAEVAAKVKEDSKFDVDALLAAIKNELRSRNVLVESDSQVSASGEIVIDDYSLRRTSNVVLFGNIYSNGTLNGALRVRDAQGNELNDRRIEAKAKITIPAEGRVENPLGPLYRQFAIEVGSALTGMPNKPDDSDSWRPR